MEVTCIATGAWILFREDKDTGNFQWSSVTKKTFSPKNSYYHINYITAILILTTMRMNFEHVPCCVPSIVYRIEST